MLDCSCQGPYSRTLGWISIRLLSQLSEGRDSPREIIIPQLAQSKLLLQRHLLLLRTLGKHSINVLHDLGHIGTAVPRHRLLDRHKVLPVIVNGLHRRTAGMVRPESARGCGLSPRGERAGVGAAHHDPWGVCSVRGVGWVKGKICSGSDAYEISDRVAQSEVLEVVAGEISIR